MSSTMQAQRALWGWKLRTATLWHFPQDYPCPVRWPTFTDARFVEPTDNTDPLYGGAVEGDYLPYVPMHQLSATVGLEHEKASLTFSLGHQSAMRDAPGQEFRRALQQLLVGYGRRGPF